MTEQEFVDLYNRLTDRPGTTLREDLIEMARTAGLALDPDRPTWAPTKDPGPTLSEGARLLRPERGGAMNKPQPLATRGRIRPMATYEVTDPVASYIVNPNPSWGDHREEGDPECAGVEVHFFKDGAVGLVPVADPRKGFVLSPAAFAQIADLFVEQRRGEALFFLCGLEEPGRTAQEPES